MTARPQPAWLYHFTRVEHLASIVREGLMSDSRAQTSGFLQLEVGNQGIKSRRRARAVPLGQGGVVADYVPFYFNPRSPMLSAIHHGRVPTYQQGCDRLVFIVTSAEKLSTAGHRPIFTDRNAVLSITAFREEIQDLDDFVDWEVIRAQYWNDFPEGRELRQAECLVHSAVPWSAVQGLVAKSQAVADEAQAVLDTIGETRFWCTVRPDLYF